MQVAAQLLGPRFVHQGTALVTVKYPLGKKTERFKQEKNHQRQQRLSVLSDGAHPNAKFGVIMGVVTIQHVTKRGAEPVAGLITLLVFAHVSTP